MEEIEWYAIFSYNFSFNYSQKGWSEFRKGSDSVLFVLMGLVFLVSSISDNLYYHAIQIDHLKLQTKNSHFYHLTKNGFLYFFL